MVAGEEKVAVNGLDSRLEQGCRWGSGAPTTQMRRMPVHCPSCVPTKFGSTT